MCTVSLQSWIMYFIGILTIFGLLAVTKAQYLPHDKIVVCPNLPQWYLDTIRNEFNSNRANWRLCTHLMVIEYYEYGKWLPIYCNHRGIATQLASNDYNFKFFIKKQYLSMTNMNKEIEILKKLPASGRNILIWRQSRKYL